MWTDTPFLSQREERERCKAALEVIVDVTTIALEVAAGLIKGNDD